MKTDHEVLSPQVTLCREREIRGEREREEGRERTNKQE